MTNDDWRDYHKIRREVLWEARGRNNYNENHPDEYLATNHPLLLKWKNVSIGTTRLDIHSEDIGIVRRVAITQCAQRQGHGRILSQEVERYARHLGLKTLFVSADENAIVFYEKMGWEHYIWQTTDFVVQEHDPRQMRKVLLDNLCR